MALARVTTWNPGDTLTAAAQNAEFNNLLNNPISLISPTTGAINFQTSVAHTNLFPGAITGSSGGVGALLIASTAAVAAAIWSTGISWTTTARQLAAQRFGAGGQANALTSNNFSLSSGWGSTAVLQSIRGNDQAFQFAILTGSTIVGNPTVTCTYQDGVWTNIPMSVCALTGGSGINSTAVVHTIAITNNSSGQIFQMFFTPSTGLVYTYQVVNMA